MTKINRSSKIVNKPKQTYGHADLYQACHGL